MKTKVLGQSGIQVTDLCFGVLPMGPVQRNIPKAEGIKIIREAVEKGITFLDTAEMYKTHDFIEEALRGYQGEVVIATKSASATYEAMAKSVENARKELKRDVIDIFHLHAARATHTVFDERAGAIECLQDLKAKGVIKAVGISTHAVDVCQLAAEKPEFDIVFPIINKLGMGIIEGDLNGMLNAIDACYKAGKGLYAMKALAGGHLIRDLVDAINYVRNMEAFASTAIGMVTSKELELNLKIFNDQKIKPEELPSPEVNKRMIVLGNCVGCGKCVKTCPNMAISLINKKAVIDHEKCILCGYCRPVCPQFALRLA